MLGGVLRLLANQAQHLLLMLTHLADTLQPVNGLGKVLQRLQETGLGVALQLEIALDGVHHPHHFDEPGLSGRVRVPASEDPRNKALPRRGGKGCVGIGAFPAGR